MALDLNSLRTMSTVISAGSFAAAGRELGYTASAISQQMSALEKSLRVRLFDREARRIVPTQAALYLHRRTEHIVDLMSQVEVDIARLGAGQTGRLRVGTFDSAGGPILGRVMARFLVRRRDVEITLDEGEPYELFPRVSDGSLDLALGFRYDLVPQQFPENLVITDVMVERLHIVAPRNHRLASKQAVHLDELRSERWVTHREQTSAHSCLQALCADHDLVPDVAFRSNNLGTVKGIVAAGLAVAMIPELAFRDTTEEIVELPIVERLPRRQIVAATRVDDTNPLTDAFLTTMREAAFA